MFITSEQDIANIQVGDKFQRYSYDKDAQVVKNGVIECTYINKTRHFFRCSGCNDFPEGYIIRVANAALKEAFFNTCPGVRKIEANQLDNTNNRFTYDQLCSYT